MNFIFISPHFPRVYWQFCNRLRNRGVNVLGIGDAPYDSLSEELKNSLTEYYAVGSLEDYDQVYRAVAFFAFKYGKIDWVESNNEHWLEQDAQLRTDFNITSGVQIAGMTSWKHKSDMKPYYEKAGIPSARYHEVSDKADALKFIKEVGGYPVIVKPDVGVGASDTWKLENDADLDEFFEIKPDVPYLMEEYVVGNIYSYDAISDSNGEPLFESSNWFPTSIADIVSGDEDLAYYTMAEVPKELRKVGRKALKAFGVKSRFVHFEFFKLSQAKKNLGKKGDFVGLEVNMRPAGGYTPEMMNYAHNCDVYEIYAEMVTDNKRLSADSNGDHYCVYASRKDNHEYRHSHEDILKKYGDRIVMCERMPDVLSGAMGNQMYTAQADSDKAVREFIKFVQERA